MRRIPKTPHRARGEVIWWHATELDVASRRAGAFSFEMFLTRCFSPCSDEIIGYCRTRPRTGGLSQGQTANRRTQHNEAPFESDATNSMKGPIIVSGKDNRLFRPTIPPPFSGDSNMRLVVLCTLIFLVSLWVIRFFSPAAPRRFRKKPFLSSDHGTREPPCFPSHATSATLCFLFFPLPPPRCVLPQPPNLLRCLLLGHLIQNRPTISLPTEVCLCPSLWCPLWAPEHGSHCGRRREYGVQQGSVSVRKNQRFRF